MNWIQVGIYVVDEVTNRQRFHSFKCSHSFVDLCRDSNTKSRLRLMDEGEGRNENFSIQIKKKERREIPKNDSKRTLTCLRSARTKSGRSRVDEDVTSPALAVLGFAALQVPKRSRTALMAASFASDSVEDNVRSTAGNYNQ